MSDDQHITADELYEQTGKALSVWSQVEETLCAIFALAVTGKVTDPIGAAASAYWAIISFEGKLKMTNAALRFRLAGHDCLLEEWHPIFNALSKKASKRAELAHGTVATWQFIDSKSGNLTNDTFFVPSLFKQMTQRAADYVTGEFDTKTPDTRPRGRLYRKDIKQRRKGFRTIDERLKQFKTRLYEALKQIEADRELLDAKVREIRSEDTPTQ